MNTITVLILGGESGHRVVKKLISIDVAEPLLMVLFNVNGQALLFVIQVWLIEGRNLRQLVNRLPLTFIDPWYLLSTHIQDHFLFIKFLLQLLVRLGVVHEVLRMEDLFLLLNGTLDEEFDLSLVDLELNLELFVRKQEAKEELVLVEKGLAHLCVEDAYKVGLHLTNRLVFLLVRAVVDDCSLHQLGEEVDEPFVSELVHVVELDKVKCYEKVLGGSL